MNSKGKSVLDAVSYITKICGESGLCKNCPINVTENDTDCSAYIIKTILEADWYGYDITPSGIMPNSSDTDC